MRPASKIVALAGVVALAGAWGSGHVGFVGAQEESQPAKSARGGILARTARHQFEVFFYTSGARVLPRTAAGGPVDVSRATGTATFYHPDSPQPWFSRPLRGTTGQAPATLDLLIIRGGIDESQGKSVAGDGAVGMAVLPGLASAQATRWQAEHDAGWDAYRQGRLEEAEARLRAAENEAEAFGQDDPRLATTLDHLAWVLCAEGKAPEAEPLAKRGLAIREKALGAEHPDVVKSLNTLACLYDMQGRPAEARPLYERCLAVSEKTQGPGNPNAAAILDNLATVDHILGKNDEAEASYKRDLEIREKTLNGKPIDLAPTLYNLGALYLDRGKFAEAELLLKRALAIREEALGAGRPPGRGDELGSSRLALREAGQA